MSTPIDSIAASNLAALFEGMGSLRFFEWLLSHLASLFEEWVAQINQLSSRLDGILAGREIRVSGMTLH